MSSSHARLPSGAFGSPSRRGSVSEQPDSGGKHLDVLLASLAVKLSDVEKLHSGLASKREWCRGLVDLSAGSSSTRP